MITLVLLRKGFPLGENKGKGVGFPKNNILPGYPTPLSLISDDSGFWVRPRFVRPDREF